MRRAQNILQIHNLTKDLQVWCYLTLLEEIVSQRLSKLTKVAQIISDGAKFQVQICRLQSPILPLHEAHQHPRQTKGDRVGRM